MKTGVFAAPAACVLAVVLASTQAARSCDQCTKFFVDGEQRFTCSSGQTSGASGCTPFPDKSGCVLTADCCGCPPGKGPIVVHLGADEYLREVGFFLDGDSRDGPSAPAAGNSHPSSKAEACPEAPTS